MSLKNKLFSVAAMTVAVGAFSMFASAQDNSAAGVSDSTQQPQQVEKREGRGFGKHDGFRGGEGRHGGKFGGRDGMMPELRGIELTDAQKEQFRAIREANRPDETTRQEIRTLAEAKHNGTLTAEQQERFQTLRQQGREKAEAVHQQMLAILTPEQLQKIEQNKQEMKQKWEQHRQMRQQNTPQTTEKPTDN